MHALSKCNVNENEWKTLKIDIFISLQFPHTLIYGYYVQKTIELKFCTGIMMVYMTSDTMYWYIEIM